MNLSNLCKVTNKIGNLKRFTCNALAASVGKEKISSSTLVMDQLQENAMNEYCFLVDTNDKIIGTASKRDCHHVQTNQHILLHRAFSVFLFNGQGDLLLQRRSEHKITYPDYFTNTCCSHPLADIVGEDDETNAIGIKRAAQRRLNYELGIPIEQIEPNDMLYLTRILYKDCGNGKWGEHEIDYILFVQKDVDLHPNRNEVSEICYLPRHQLNQFVQNLKAPLTPWFNLILKHRLCIWWDNLNRLDQFIDHRHIHTFTTKQ